MTDTWVYDVESYINLFMISFIPMDTDQRLIDAYIAADKAGNREDKKKLLQYMNVKTFIIFRGYYDDKYIKDDRWLLHDFLRVHKVIYGFNSTNYDSIMVDLFQVYSKFFGKDLRNKEGMCFAMFLNDYSNRIINYGKNFRYTLDFYSNYRRYFKDRDIQKILYLDKSMTGLKKVAINLKWYRIQELPIPPDKTIHSSQLYDIVDYNINDILITLALIRDQKDELAIRETGSKEFDLDLSNLSRSSIGKALVTKYYHELTGVPIKNFINEKTIRYVIKVKEIIDSKIDFKTPKFQNLYNNVRSSKINITADTDKAKWGFSLLHNGVKYVMAKGGLHSKDDAKVYDIIGLDNMIMRDADVTSFYPKIILNLRIGPKHLDIPVFLAIVDYVMTSRVKAKHKIKELFKIDPEASELIKKKAEIYKIAINRMYGAFKDQFDYLYDPECTYKTTINGQFYLLALAEDFELNGINVISANTDGIVCLFDKSLEPKYKEICDKWQTYFDFELEFTDYEKYIRNDVNNYIAIKKGFSHKYNTNKDVVENLSSFKKQLEKEYVKRKGLFIDKPDFSKGFINPVVSTALANFYIYNEDILEGLKKHAKKPGGVYDFCITQKIDKKFEAQYHSIVDGKKEITKLQQYNRFYVSSSNTGNILKYDATKRKHISIIAKENVRLLNVYRDEEITDINFKYYVNECYKIIYGNKKKSGISDMKLDFDFGIDSFGEDYDIPVEMPDEVTDDYLPEYASLYENDEPDENGDIPF